MRKEILSENQSLVEEFSLSDIEKEDSIETYGNITSITKRCANTIWCCG